MLFSPKYRFEGLNRVLTPDVVAWRMRLIPSACTPGSWAFVVFTLVCPFIYAPVALRVATSLSVLSHQLVVHFTEFAARLERTWESQDSLEVERATRSQAEGSRRRSRASSSSGLEFSKLAEGFDWTVFAEDAEASLSCAPGLGSLDFAHPISFENSQVVLLW